MQFDSSHIQSNKKFWQALSPEELAQYEQFLFEHYRASGYPGYVKPSSSELEKAVNTTKKYLNSDQGKTIITATGEVRQTMHLLGELWSYYPHYTSVSCAGQKTMDEAFADDKTLKTVIHKRLKYGDYMGDSAIRKAMRAYGAQTVSNFRPTAAAALYNRYAPPGATVWDMCGGYGGRMTGAWLSDTVRVYHFNEPDMRTRTGTLQLARDLADLNQSRLSMYDSQMDMCVMGYPAGSEIMKMPAEVMDMVFTSPPYFNTELYSEEQTQSAVKYPDYSDWLNIFLFDTISAAAQALKTGGYFLLNIANVKSAPTLADDALSLLKNAGLQHETTLNYALSGRSGNVTAGGFRYEPIFVMKKV